MHRAPLQLRKVAISGNFPNPEAQAPLLNAAWGAAAVQAQSPFFVSEPASGAVRHTAGVSLGASHWCTGVCFKTDTGAEFCPQTLRGL